MPLTVVDSIATVLMTRLSTLIGGDEQTDVVEVIRPSRLGNYTPKDLQIVVTQANPERVTDLDCPGSPPALCWRQVFNINCHVMPSEMDATSVDQLSNQFAADVVKAVTSPSTWHSFGGYSINAEWLDIQNMQTGEACDGVTLPIAITYRVSENNPYEVRA